MARIRTGMIDALRDVVMVACESVGVDPLNVMARGETVDVDNEGVSVSLHDERGRTTWRLIERYQVSEPGGLLKERRETRGTFEIGDESVCARAAAILVCEHRIDAALDAVG
jgi:hypothetical protein